MKILSFSDYLIEKKDPNDGSFSSDGFTFRNGVFGGTRFKSNRKMDPIDISGDTKLMPKDDKVVLGIRNWERISGIDSKRKKGSKDQYEWITLENKGASKEYREGDQGFDAAVRFISRLTNQLYSDSSKSEDSETAKDISSDDSIYRLLLDKALSALVMMRAILPVNAKDKPEIKDLLDKFNIYSKIIEILSQVNPDNASHKKMWNDIKKLGEESERYVEEFGEVWGKLEKAPEGGETRIEMVNRGALDLKNAKEKYSVTGNGASAFIKAGIDSYANGGLNLLDSNDINLNSLQKAFPEIIKKYKEKEEGGAVNESYSNLKNRSDLFERKKSDDSSTAQTQEVSYSTLLNQVISLAGIIDSFIDFFIGSPFEKEIRSSAVKYQKPLQEAAQFLTSNNFSQIRGSDAGGDKIKEITANLEKLSAQSGDMSIAEWKNKSLEKYGDAQISNDFLNDGDAKIAKAQEIVNNMVKISSLKQKAASNQLQNVIANIANADQAGDSKIDRIDGGDGYDEAKSPTSRADIEELQKEVSQILGTSKSGSGKMTPEEMMEIARYLTLLTGKTYRTQSGSPDTDEINRDIRIFFEKRSNIKKELGIPQGESDSKPGAKKEKVDTKNPNDGSASGNYKTTQKAIDARSEAAKILEDLIKNASGLGASQKRSKWENALKNVNSIKENDLCSKETLSQLKEQSDFF